MVGGKERRSSPRVPSRFPLRYQAIPDVGSGYIDADVEDMSLDGVRFQCHDEVRPHAGMLFELCLADKQPLHFFGRIAWVRAMSDHRGFEVGSRFEDQSTWGRKTVERFLQRDSVFSSP